VLTIEVAERENIPVKDIQNAIALRLFPPPAKDRSGRFVWTDRDVARMRKAVQDRRRGRRSRQEGAANVR
jgi:hypothetical protein